MNRCDNAIQNGADCNKTICCFDCAEREKCEFRCTETTPDGCSDLIPESNALAVFEKKYAAVFEQIAQLENQKAAIEETEKSLKSKLACLMPEYGVKKFENSAISICYVEPTVTRTIDTTKLKAEKPDIAAAYTKETPKAGYVKITVKGGKK